MLQSAMILQKIEINMQQKRIKHIIFFTLSEFLKSTDCFCLKIPNFLGGLLYQRMISYGFTVWLRTALTCSSKYCGLFQAVSITDIIGECVINKIMGKPISKFPLIPWDYSVFQNNVPIAVVFWVCLGLSMTSKIAWSKRSISFSSFLQT